MLTVEAGESVTLRSTTRRTVDFFSRHAGNDEMGVLAEQMMDMLVDWLTRWESAGEAEAQRRDAGAVIEYLRGMEARQAIVVSAEVERGGETVKSALMGVEVAMAENAKKVCAMQESASAKMESKVDGIEGKMQGQMLGLITSVEAAVRGSVERLNADVLAMKVSDTVKEWLQVDIESVKAGQVTAREAMGALERVLRMELAQQVTDPMRRQGEAIAAQLTALPGLCEAARGARDAETDAKLTEVRQRLGASIEAQAESVSSLKAIVVEVSGKVGTVIGDIERMCGEGKERSVEQRTAMHWHAEHVPRMVKGVMSEALKEVEQQTSVVRAAVSGVQQELVSLTRDMADNKGSMCVLRKVTDDALARLEALSHQVTVWHTRSACNQKAKGQEGETRLYELLSDKLTMRDGYDVEVVSGTSHACDISIKRLGYPEIRVENKAHGLGTAEKVRAKEVARFCNDLLGLNCSGLFLSQHAGIVGKGECEVELLSNNRVAVFISNCNYNMDLVHDMLQVVYRLEKIISKHTEASGGDGNAYIRVTPEAMQRVGVYMKDFTNKVGTAKTHLRETLSLLSELTFDAMERVLMGQTAAAVTAVMVAEGGHRCDECNATYKTRQALCAHRARKHTTRAVNV